MKAAARPYTRLVCSDLLPVVHERFLLSGSTFQIRGSWSMQISSQRNTAYSHARPRYTLISHGARQHKDCRLFIQEKFAHVWFCLLFLLFDYNCFDSLSIGGKRLMLFFCCFPPCIPPAPALSALNRAVWYYTRTKWGNSRSWAMITPLIILWTTFYFLCRSFTNWLHFSIPPGHGGNFISCSNFWQGWLQFMYCFFFHWSERREKENLLSNAAMQKHHVNSDETWTSLQAHLNWAILEICSITTENQHFLCC